jgi:hypothetical protein
MNNFELQRHNCFGCGLKNDIGLKLNFTKKNDLIVGSYITNKDYEGFPDILHGGIQTTILDEAMNWAFLVEDIFVFTIKIAMKFRSPIRIGQKIIIEAEAKRDKKKFTASGRIYLESGKLATEALGEFYKMKNDEKTNFLKQINEA